MKLLNIKIFSIAFLLFFSTRLIFSQDNLNLKNPLILYMDRVYDVIPHAEIFEDKSGSLSFEEIVEKDFKKSDKDSYNFGFTTSTLWLKFQVLNQNSSLDENWIFFVEYPQLDSVNFFFPVDEESPQLEEANEKERELVYIEKQGGDQFQFSERDIDNRFLNFTVPNKIKKNPIIYIRVRTTSVMQIPIYLSSMKQFHIKNDKSLILMGIYFGIMVIMGFYNFFLFIVLRERLYIFYVATVFCTILYMISFHGFGYRYIWSASPYVQGKIIHLSALLFMVFLNFFTMEFLETKKNTPKIDLALKALLGLTIPGLILVFLFDTSFPIIFVNLISILHPFFFMTAAIFVLIQGNKSARLYLVGWSFAGVMGILLIMRSFGLIQNLLIINFLSQLAGAFEVAFFSFALADRISILKNDKKRMEEELIENLEKANQELEKRVKIRTKELSRSNKQNEALLLNILPNHVIDRIKSKDEVLIVDSIPFSSILFTDVVGFTKLSQTIDAQELIVLLNNVFSHFDVLTMVHNLEKMKTIGDSYMVVGGLPGTIENHLEAMADLALDLLKFSHQKELLDLLMKYPEFKIRIGIHCGPAVAGVIGLEKIAYDIWGDTVNTASRMEAYGVPDMIHTSRQVYDKLKGKFSFEKRGLIEIKGKGMLETYFLMGKLDPKSKNNS